MSLIHPPPSAPRPVRPRTAAAASAAVPRAAIAAPGATASSTAPRAAGGRALPPLTLYIHIPWCARRCPYCDFNAHTDARNGAQTLDGDLERAYIEALRLDLAASAPQAAGRALGSIFFGGGTPSLMSAPGIAAILAAAGDCMELAADAEISLEANPGAVEAGRFASLREAGVNRLSLGVQSFDDGALERLGRIHSARRARDAVAAARCAGFDRFNMDLMYGLPGQTLASGLADLQCALDLQVPHLSWYELNIEPNTPFYSDRPQLPPESLVAELQERGTAMLTEARLAQYEVSAHALTGHRCHHNLNYWQFGDYLGVGAGAHSKTTDGGGLPVRRARLRQPAAYMARPTAATGQPVADPLGEYLMNAMRLVDGFALADCLARSGAPQEQVLGRLRRMQGRGFVALEQGRARPTAHGLRYLNEALLA